jgi:excisionase family DNA binding protein
MEIVTSFTKKELEQIISEQVTQCLNDKLSPPQPESSDRCGIDEACKITGLSSASIYKMTHLKKIPFMKFGRALVFSKRQLAQWLEENTISPADLGKELDKSLIAAAQKHLRNNGK